MYYDIYHICMYYNTQIYLCICFSAAHNLNFTLTHFLFQNLIHRKTPLSDCDGH